MFLKSFLFLLLLLCGLMHHDLVSCSMRGSIQHSYPTRGQSRMVIVCDPPPRPLLLDFER